MFLCLLYGVMIDFHLFGEILFKPLVLLDIVIDEMDGQLPVDLHGCFSRLAVVEPCLCPPSDAGTIGIDADYTRNVETLYVDVEFRKWIDQVTAGYRYVFGFFFSSVLSDERNTW